MNTDSALSFSFFFHATIICSPEKWYIDPIHYGTDQGGPFFSPITEGLHCTAVVVSVMCLIITFFLSFFPNAENIRKCSCFLMSVSIGDSDNWRHAEKELNEFSKCFIEKQYFNSGMYTRSLCIKCTAHMGVDDIVLNDNVLLFWQLRNVTAQDAVLGNVSTCCKVTGSWIRCLWNGFLCLLRHGEGSAQWEEQTLWAEQGSSIQCQVMLLHTAVAHQ